MKKKLKLLDRQIRQTGVLLGLILVAYIGGKYILGSVADKPYLREAIRWTLVLCVIWGYIAYEFYADKKYQYMDYFGNNVEGRKHTQFIIAIILTIPILLIYLLMLISLIKNSLALA